MSTNNAHFEQLRQRIVDKTATVAIVGMGYVGLPLAKRMLDAGFSVIGFDIDEQKIKDLQGGVDYLKHLGNSYVQSLHDSGKFSPTQNPDDLSGGSGTDVIILCVPTPLDENKEPDLQYIKKSAEMVAGVLRHAQLVVLESTTWPGTTREILLRILEKSGLQCGSDFFVGYSPEREDPGRTDPPATEVPKIVSGIDTCSADLAELLYAGVYNTIHRTSSVEVAESSKLLENIYRSVNIALVNEMKVILEKLDIDIWEVIEAASTKPYGFTPFYPGPGLGGHCIPIDPYYMSWKARESGIETRFIELAGEINRNMPQRVVDKVESALSDEGVSLKDARVLVLGIAYKPNVDDIREAPAAEIISLLQGCGATVSYHDPLCPTFPAMKKYNIDLHSVQLTADELSVQDVVLVVTNHDIIDWELVAKHSSLVVDTRNVMATCPQCKARIVKA